MKHLEIDVPGIDFYSVALFYMWFSIVSDFSTLFFTRQRVPMLSLEQLNLFGVFFAPQNMPLLKQFAPKLKKLVVTRYDFYFLVVIFKKCT